MASVRVVHKVAGYKAIRRAPGVQAALVRRAESIANRANSASGTDGFRTSSRQGRAKPQGRWRATVITANLPAVRHNARHNTLLKSMGSR